jgi:hypothetical protein
VIIDCSITFCLGTPWLHLLGLPHLLLVGGSQAPLLSHCLLVLHFTVSMRVMVLRYVDNLVSRLIKILRASVRNLSMNELPTVVLPLTSCHGSHASASLPNDLILNIGHAHGSRADIGLDTCLVGLTHHLEPPIGLA